MKVTVIFSLADQVVIICRLSTINLLNSMQTNTLSYKVRACMHTSMFAHTTGLWFVCLPLQTGRCSRLMQPLRVLVYLFTKSHRQAGSKSRNWSCYSFEACTPTFKVPVDCLQKPPLPPRAFRGVPSYRVLTRPFFCVHAHASLVLFSILLRTLVLLDKASHEDCT